MQASKHLPSFSRSQNYIMPPLMCGLLSACYLVSPVVADSLEGAEGVVEVGCDAKCRLQVQQGVSPTERATHVFPVGDAR